MEIIDIIKEVIEKVNEKITPFVQKHDKTITILLCVFLGHFGAHRFYQKKVVTGILFIATGGFWGVGQIVDIILILRNQFNPINKTDDGSVDTDATESEVN